MQCARPPSDSFSQAMRQMPDGREHARIADKYQLDYYRQSRPTRSWKWPATGLAIVLALALAGALYGFLGDRAFQAAPVAAVHASFGGDCFKCHDQTWQPAVRLATADGDSRSVSNQSCLACHKDTAGHQSATHAADPACAACHAEHRPDVGLLSVSDSSCTACHADLEAHPGPTGAFAGAITGFGDDDAHPEFALFRQADAPPPATHGVWRTAVRPEGSTAWHDAGGVKLNHALHLPPEGVLNSKREVEVLKCADCHVETAGGEYMAPINYEQHCARCHPLQLAEPFDQLRTIPHEKPDVVRGVIRAWLAGKLAGESPSPTDPPEDADPPPPPSLLPEPDLIERGRADYVDAVLRDADHAIFGLEAKGFCRKCHHVEADGQDWEVLTFDPAVVSPRAASPRREMIPSRWFQHAEFSHRKHRSSTTDCADCHDVSRSKATVDVLLPSIAQCRTCHGASATNAAGRTGDHCTQCHSYHDPTHATQTNRPAAP